MEIFDFILHVDAYLETAIELFGVWTYAVLFAVIFTETGLVVMPFLPGDSLLFAVGALSGSGFMNVWTAYIVMMTAVIVGDNTNYWIGHHIGPRVFSGDTSRVFNKKNLEKTGAFYSKYGGKTIILARFVPIVRTFAPFVAGVGRMHYRTFLAYSLTGAFIWVTSLTAAGYFFGGLPFVKANFEYVVIGIVLLSLLPMVVEYLRSRRGANTEQNESPERLTYENVQEVFKKEHLND